MLSPIRIGLFVLCALFLCLPNLSHAQTRPEALPPLDSLDIIEMGQITGSLFDLSGSLKETANQLLEAVEKDLIRIDTSFAIAKKDSSSSKVLLDSLSAALKGANTRYKKAEKLSQRAEKVHDLTSVMTDMDSLGIRKNLPKAWKQVTQLYDELYPPLPTETLAKSDEVSDNEADKGKKARGEGIKPKPAVQPGFKKYDPSADVMLHPPVPPCVIASSSRDEFSGEITREMAAAELFRYTNPQLKTYLQGKTHIICEAALVSTGAKGTLLLTFRINDPNARKAFGRLEKNSVATLKFIDGSVFELQNALADDGIFSPDNEASIFRAHYPLSPEALRKIRRTELDKLRILWSKGFDDYDVQQVDLLMRQADCLFK